MNAKTQQPIAIIGVSCLFPGADGPEEFWRNLLSERDLVVPVDQGHWKTFPGPIFRLGKGHPDRTCNLHGGWREDISLASENFSLSPELLCKLDRPFRWALHAGQQVLKDSGVVPSASILARCGLVLGGYSWAPSEESMRLLRPLYASCLQEGLRQSRRLGDLELIRPEELERRPAPENALMSGMIAALVAKGLSLGGPHYAIDAACASSLYCLKLASFYLWEQRCDLMLAGGITAYHRLFNLLGFSALQALPNQVRSCPLDKHSDGLAPAEGAAMFALKRLDDAHHDGDNIYAIIRGIGLSNDGRDRHLLAPSAKGQYTAYKRAYEEAELPLGDVQYIDCHATGTDLGDKTELDSLSLLLADNGSTPLLGSVKANVGHLLTAAGLASALKVILSMRAGTIPATISVTEPLEARTKIGADRVVRSVTPWPDAGQRRRGAVNAFGFGGANAHLILEQPPPGEAYRNSFRAFPRPEEPLAIVGIGGVFGDCQGLERLRQNLYSGFGTSRGVPPGRWRGIEQLEEGVLDHYGLIPGTLPEGGYIEKFQIEAVRLRLPPENIDRLCPQQLLMLQVADGALRDAGLQPGGRVAVIIATSAHLAVHRLHARWEMEELLDKALQRAGFTLEREERENLLTTFRDSLHHPVESGEFASYIGNLMASRIASQWDFSGPAFTISAEENSVFRALEVAQMLLRSRESDAVLVGAVDFAASPESVITRRLQTGTPPGPLRLSFDMEASGWPVGEGAGAAVLERVSDARRECRTIYCVAESLAITTCQRSRANRLDSAGQLEEALKLACDKALGGAGRSPEEIGFLEAHASGVPEEDTAEMRVFSELLGNGTSAPRIAVGSAKSLVGHCYAASGIASLIRAAFCLRDRYLPGSPDWGSPKPDLDHRAFFIPQRSQPWLVAQERQRVAMITGLSQDGSAACVVLSEERGCPRPVLQTPGANALQVLAIAGSKRSVLAAELERLANRLHTGTAIERLSRESLQQIESLPEAALVFCLVARNREELAREIDAARVRLSSPADGFQTWRTPAGSCLSFEPLGRSGGVAFVYPSIDTAYVGMQRDLFQLFPNTFEKLSEHFQDPAFAFVDAFVHPRSLRRLTPGKLEQAETELRGSISRMFRAGVGYSMVATRGLREGLGVEPAHALGFSLGEMSMLFSLNVWTPNDARIERLETTVLLREELSGLYKGVRKFFGLTEEEKLDWSARVLLAGPSEVQAAVAARRDVFLAQISTPREVVICGKEDACESIVATLGCEAFRTDFEMAVHCPPTGAYLADLTSWLEGPVSVPTRTRIHFSCGQTPEPWNEYSVAAAVADGIAGSLDFPRVVEQAYNAGARIFIEVGPRNTCSRRIKAILGESPHEALAFDQRGSSARDNLAKLLAGLISHRIPLKLGPWIEMLNRLEPAESSLLHEVSLCAPSIAETVAAKLKELSVTRKEAASPAVVSARGEVPAPGDFRLPPDRRLSTLREISAIAQTTTQTHRAFLEQHTAALRDQMAPAIFQQSIGPSDQPLHNLEVGRRNGSSRSVLYKEADIMEFTEGKVSRVFGPSYADIDLLRRRVRLPSAPFLAVSRVIALEAKPFQLEPCSIETEFDIPNPYWCAIDGQVPLMAADAQGVLFLLGYLGVDRHNRGERVYRWLDGKMRFGGLFLREGQTVHYKIQIRSFARHQDTLLFFAEFEGKADGRTFLEIPDSCAGFFTDEELKQGQGLKENQKSTPQQFPACIDLRNISEKRQFSEYDLTALQLGDLCACFGPQYAPLARNNPSLRLPPGPMRMVDRILSVSPPISQSRSGAQLTAEKQLHPNDWYLRCHFKDSPVFAGPCMLEACQQLLQFYALFLRLPGAVSQARFAPFPAKETRVRFRSQVAAESSIFTIKMHVVDFGFVPRPYVLADFDLIHHEVAVGRIENFGVWLVVPEADGAHSANPLPCHSKAGN
jgi:PfaB family protein